MRVYDMPICGYASSARKSYFRRAAGGWEADHGDFVCVLEVLRCWRAKRGCEEWRISCDHCRVESCFESREREDGKKQVESLECEAGGGSRYGMIQWHVES